MSMTRELETRIAGISGILETNAKVVDFADLVSSQQFSVLADAGLYGVIRSAINRRARPRSE